VWGCSISLSLSLFGGGGRDASQSNGLNKSSFFLQCEFYQINLMVFGMMTNFSLLLFVVGISVCLVPSLSSEGS